jgi:hypothetical protein
MYALSFVLAIVSAGSVVISIRSYFESRAWLVVFAATLFGICTTLSRNVVIFGMKPLGLTLATGVSSWRYWFA